MILRHVADVSLIFVDGSRMEKVPMSTRKRVIFTVAHGSMERRIIKGVMSSTLIEVCSSVTGKMVK